MGKQPVSHPFIQLEDRDISPRLMALVIVALVIAVFVVLLDANRNAGGQPGGQVGQPDDYYLQLVLQVPRTVNPNSTLNQLFTIHGLWPTSKYCSNNDQFLYCGRNYTPAEIGNELTPGLQNDLNHAWPNVETPNDPWGFWSRQYNKHGSCASHISQTPEAYFRRAEYLYRGNRVQDLYNLFASIRLPGLGQVNAEIYRKLIKNNRGGIPKLRCNRASFLKEVVICYNKTATEVIDCPPKGPKRGNCNGPIEYPI